MNIDPKYYFLYYNLGMAYQRLGNSTQAKQFYQKYLTYITELVERKEVEKLLKK